MEFKYYVYLLIDPRTNKPFYVGKGSGTRAYQHLSDFETSNENKQKAISEIKADGLNTNVVIINDNLPEVLALNIEAYLINTIPNLTNILRPKNKGKVIGSYKLEEPIRYE